MPANSCVILFGFTVHKEFICEKKTNQKKQTAKSLPQNQHFREFMKVADPQLEVKKNFIQK